MPVIQLNHPRWSGIDYFGKAELDPLTGVSNSEIYGEDFDSVEVEDIVITVPIALKRRGVEARLVIGGNAAVAVEPDAKLIEA